MITVKKSDILHYDIKNNTILVKGIGWVHNDYVTIEQPTETQEGDK